jgi:hypothetical protein
LALAILVLLAVAFFWSADIGLAHRVTSPPGSAPSGRNSENHMQQIVVVTRLHIQHAPYRAPCRSSA